VRRAATGRLDHEPTYFELMTALALWTFAREKVDWVVWETGLGGRLDATNIVNPEICIITNIGLDHQQYLGGTLADIAAEKAGIIKPGVPVVTAVERGEASEVIRDRIKRKKCLSTFIVGSYAVDLGLREGRQRAMIEMGYEPREFSVGLIGSHQVKNAACAVAAMDHLRWGHGRTINPPDQPRITPDSVSLGLASTSWPGRFEILSDHPLLVIDGAHNAAGTKMLVETWRAFLAAKFGWKPDEIDGHARIIFASVADKDISEMAQLLRPLAKEVALVRLENDRGADPRQLAPAFAGLPVARYDSVADAWQSVEHSDPSSVTLITGSLFLVGEMLARRQGIGEEYRLNERLEKISDTTFFR
jgi:dihydrofolate synthase/folylpolyglutamate synthase